MYLSVSLRRPLEMCELTPEKGGKNKVCSGLAVSRCCSADRRPADLLKSWSREAHLSTAGFVEPVSDSIGHGRVTRRRPQEHTHEHWENFRPSKQRSFPQDTHHICTTVDGSTGTVCDSKVVA